MSFAFTDGHGAWDSNDGHNYSTPVWQVQQASAAPPRGIASTEVSRSQPQQHSLTLSCRPWAGSCLSSPCVRPSSTPLAPSHMHHMHPPPAAPSRTQTVDHAGGKLHVITLAPRAAADRASKDSRWKEEKVMRVWTPPGPSLEQAPPGG